MFVEPCEVDLLQRNKKSNQILVKHFRSHKKKRLKLKTTVTTTELTNSNNDFKLLYKGHTGRSEKYNASMLFILLMMEG